MLLAIASQPSARLSLRSLRHCASFISSFGSSADRLSSQLAIALAANIGGQCSPISSPQNLIALHEMDVQIDWLGWFAVAIPVAGTSIILIWLLLLVTYSPSKTIDGEDLVIKPIRPTRESFTIKQYYVAFVCMGTIALWCVEHKLEYALGDMGIIALIPIVAFFGTGILKKVCRITYLLGHLVLTCIWYRQTLTSSSGLWSSSPWEESRSARPSRPVVCWIRWT